jgi:septal ring factor EnvC (AmiA/AmiB activator)
MKNVRTPMRHGEYCRCRLCETIYSLREDLDAAMSENKRSAADNAQLTKTIDAQDKRILSLQRDRKALSRSLSIIFSQIHIDEKGAGE